MQDIPLYIFVSFIACLTPGSGVLYTVANGFRGGLKTVLASPCGTTLGVALMSAVSATGLGALIASSPLMYAILQLVSAALMTNGDLSVAVASGIFLKNYRQLFLGSELCYLIE